MRTGTAALRDSLLAVRYAVIFGGIISLFLAVAQIERAGHPPASPHRVAAADTR